MKKTLNSREEDIAKLRELAQRLSATGNVNNGAVLPTHAGALSLEELTCILVIMGDKKNVELSLKLKADPNYVNKSGKSLLQLAEAFRHDDIVKLLKENGANPTPRKRFTKK